MQVEKLMNNFALNQNLSVSEWCSTFDKYKITVEQFKTLFGDLQYKFGKCDLLRILNHVVISGSSNGNDFETVGKLIFQSLGIRALDNLQNHPCCDSDCDDEIEEKIMHIRIFTLTGKDLRFDLMPSDTIGDVKARIQDREGFPPSEQTFYYNRIKLEDDKTLRDYKIKNNSEIMLVLRLRGGKPVIYIYPKEETEVDVKIEIKNGEFSFFYPEFDEGTTWHVTAKPDGELIHKGKKLNYLFWETLFYPEFDMSKGFCVHKSEIIAFLENTLKKFQLNDKEICDFVTFWAPRLVESEYSLISFQFDRFDEECPLTVTPKPDNMIRVFMAAKPLSSKVDIAPQEIPSYNRDGYCVVEWGGSIVKY